MLNSRLIKIQVTPFPVHTGKVTNNQSHQRHAVHMISNRLRTLYPMIDPSLSFCALQNCERTVQEETKNA